MVIYRQVPSAISFETTVIYPGAQFISDSRFAYLKERYNDFKTELKRNIACLTKPIAPGGTKEIDDPNWKPDHNIKTEQKPNRIKVPVCEKEKKSLAEEILAMTEEEAVDVVDKIIDAADLKEVQAADNRRAIQAACAEQWEHRGTALERLSPRAILHPNKDITEKVIHTSDDPIVRKVAEESFGGRK